MERINFTPPNQLQLAPQQSEFQTAMTTLRNDPEQFLSENRILNPTCNAHHADTFFADVHLTQDDGLVRLNEVDDGEVGDGNILYTDMRDTNAPDRFNAPSVVSLRDQNVTISRNGISHSTEQDPPLWLTPQQSGCTVLIARHGRSEAGDQQYSMIHMRPRDGDDFADELTPELYANTQEVLLERDIHRTLANAFPHDMPEAFILVPSQEGIILEGNCTQLVGIGDENGEFNFYKQTYSLMEDHNQVQALAWTQLQPPEQHPNPQLHINLA